MVAHLAQATWMASHSRLPAEPLLCPQRLMQSQTGTASELPASCIMGAASGGERWAGGAQWTTQWTTQLPTNNASPLPPLLIA